MPRKTIEVETTLAFSNTYLSSPDSTPDGRLAICALIESVLEHSNQYYGFRYLETDEVEGSGTRRRYYMKSDEKND